MKRLLAFVALFGCTVSLCDKPHFPTQPAPKFSFSSTIIPTLGAAVLQTAPCTSPGLLGGAAAAAIVPAILLAQKGFWDLAGFPLAAVVANLAINQDLVNRLPAGRVKKFLQSRCFQIPCRVTAAALVAGCVLALERARLHSPEMYRLGLKLQIEGWRSLGMGAMAELLCGFVRDFC